MAASNFDKCFKFILQFEGGFTNDPKDPGGPTNLGITQATLSAFIGLRQRSPK
jgi:lysozyme family protein